MKERPILFNTEMVPAILDGRKTQTRRVVKPQPPMGFRAWHGLINGYQAWTTHDTQGEKGFNYEAKCPYGEPGDSLWVREKFTLECPYKHTDGCGNPDHVIYWASERDVVRESITSRWRPSIHMPRWASRITLEVTGVRVEPVQSITPQDIEAEGTSQVWKEAVYINEHKQQRLRDFRHLWNTINANHGFSWEVNPWVWIIEFQVM